MFDKRALRGLSRAEVVGYLAERDVRITELRSKHRLSAADESDLQDLTEECRQLDGQLSRLDMTARVRDGDPAVALSGPDGGMRRLDGTLVPGYEPLRREDEPADQLGGQRSVAMRSLDAAVKRGLPARAAEVCERLVGVGPDHERSWTARWVAETGADAYRAAFGKLLVHGEQGAGLRFTPQERAAFERVVRLKAEQRSMSLTDNQGGYLVPFELDPSIMLTNAGSINPLMRIGRVINTVSDVWHGISSEGVTAEWLAEASEASDGSPTLAEPTIPSYKMSCFVPFSVELEGDATALVTELGSLLQDGAAQLLNASLTTGDGTGEPTGVITALVTAGAPVVVPSLGTDAFAAGDVFALQNSLPARFSANAQWCAHLATINAARQMETTNGAPKFPELGQGMLLGRSVNELSNMDGVINSGQNNYTLAYGDWSKFVVTQRVGSSIELIPYLVGANRRPTGQRGVWLWGRYGSDVVVPAAFRLLNVT